MSFARTLFLTSLIFGSAMQALSQCSGSVNVVNPVEGATVSSHFPIDAVASSSCSISSLHIYMNNVLQFVQYKQPALSGKFNAPLGKQTIVVQAFASDGTVFKKTVHVTVNQQVSSTCKPAFDPNVDVCAPIDLSEWKGPVLIHAAARSSVSPVVQLQAFAGGVLKAASFNGNATEIDAAFTLPRGVQSIDVVAHSSNGADFHNMANIQVVSAATSCQLPFISIGRPTPGEAVEFPVVFAGADAAACPITSLQVFVDGRLAYSQSNQKLLEGRLTIPPGQHTVTLQATNSQGAISKKAIQINVTGMQEPTCIDGGGVCLSTEVITSRYVIIMAAPPANPPSPYTAMKIYLDGIVRAAFYGFAAQDGITFIQMKSGSHRVTAKAWRRDGTVLSASQTVTVP